MALETGDGAGPLMNFKSKKPDSRNRVPLNLASMIDVVFLLLIFFLFSSIITPSESQLTPNIQTQQVSSASRSTDFSPQVLSVEIIDGKPGYRIGSRVIATRSELLELLRELPHELGVFVRVSDSVPVGFAVGAIQCCRDAGFEKVTYVPESK